MYTLYMPQMTTKQMREKLADTVNRVAYKGERIVIMRHGKPLAAVVSVEDLEALERLEEAKDVADAKKILARVASGRDKLIPWAKVRKSLGR
jgi:prevent-host-death family protein